jgi:hypothetical protein
LGLLVLLVAVLCLFFGSGELLPSLGTCPSVKFLKKNISSETTAPISFEPIKTNIFFQKLYRRTGAKRWQKLTRPEEQA